MRRKILLLLFLPLVAFFVGASASTAFAAVNDHNVTCSLTSGGTAVECTGQLSGLSNTTTYINVSAPFTCYNKAGNEVVGQSTGSSGPITPKNGNVKFDVTTQSEGHTCTDSDGHYITWGHYATLTVVQNGVVVFQQQYYIQGT